VQSNSARRESGRELPFVYLLATLATLAQVPPILDRLDRAFVKQSVKRGLDHPLNHLVNWPLAGLIGIVRIHQQLQVLRDLGFLLHIERSVWRLP
jgi:hypothetical protein